MIPDNNNDPIQLSDPTDQYATKKIKAKLLLLCENEFIYK
jgi:hypothetical protein